MKPQVDITHYDTNYNNLLRWISYYHQIESIIELNPKNILEIGVGNKTIYNYLKQNKYNITSCDFDKRLNPDIVGDIRKLPIKNKQYDLVCAFEVLEHIPFTDFEIAIRELNRISKKYIIISIPHFSINIEWVIKIPFLYRLFKKFYFGFRISIPYPIKHNFDGEHYWELGKKGYSVKKIKNVLQKHFKILKDYRNPLNSYHHIFVLEKTYNK
ncbi:MAG: methyltransferase domain-containing protein [Candidatus ainarchaeum sp.]|nr:methyltransferase domain-containing protein [Candidatus ainarchaeum sp.]